MAERDQAHRQNLEHLATTSDIRHRDELVASQRENAQGVFRSDLAGQVLGGLIAFGALAGSVYIAAVGGSALVSIALVSLPIAAIVKAVRAQRVKDSSK